jgi:formate dehydrogenase maturation protein FdhE
MEQPKQEFRYACSVCAHEQDSMRRACDKCGSVRVVTINALTELVGEDWKRQILDR